MLIDITYPLTNWGWTSSSCSTKWLFMSSDGSGSRRLATSIKIQTFELHSTWVFTGKLSPALLHMSKACNHYVLLSFLMVNLTNWQQVEPRAIGKWFHGKVCKILMTFLWSIRVQTKENCCWFGFFFFFCNNTDIVMRISVKVSRKITCTRKGTTNCHTIISLPCSDSYQPYGSWPISVWKIIQLWQKHMLKAIMKFRIKWFQPVLILNFLSILGLILYCMTINN